MIIKTIAETSYSGMFKLTPEEGSAFFVRKEYLPEGLFERLERGEVFDDEKADLLMDAGLTCAVEFKAVGYLARAEQSRFGLTRKLIEKKYDKKYVEAALTYLEGRGYLSDLRYATAWLNTVAKAAPRTPISNPKIKIGSSTIFMLTATIVAVMEKRG